MSILTKTANDLDAGRITLSELQGDLFNVASQASALLALLEFQDDGSAPEERGHQQRMARMVANGVELLASALSHATAEVLDARLSELCAGKAVQP